jgi:hypothetical protein
MHRMTMADAGLAYVNRPGGVKSYDLWRLDQLNSIIGDYSLARAAEGWSEFKRQRCAGLAPATVDRFRAILQAALNYAATEEQMTAPKLPRGGRIQNKRMRFLSKDQETRLLASYAPHVKPVAETLCWQGLRIGGGAAARLAGRQLGREYPIRARDEKWGTAHGHAASAGASHPTSALGRGRLAQRRPGIPQPVGAALCRPATIQIARGQPDPEGPSNGL